MYILYPHLVELPRLCSSHIPGTHSLEPHSGGWCKPPHHISPSPCLPPSLTVESHSKQSSGSNCHKQKNPLFIWSETAVPMSTRYHREWGEKCDRMNPWYSYKKKEINLNQMHIFLSLSLFSFFDALGKNNHSCTFGCRGSSPCLVDCTGIISTWVSCFLIMWGEIGSCSCTYHAVKTFFSLLSEVSDSPECNNLLSNGTNLYIKRLYLALASLLAETL